MKESEIVDQFMTRVSGIVTQFQTYGKPLEQNIIWCLTKNFAMVVISIEEAKGLSKFTLEELIGSLLSHEARLNQEEESLANYFSTQDSLNRSRARGGWGRGRRGQGSLATEKKTSHNNEHLDHSKHSHKY